VLLLLLRLLLLLLLLLLPVYCTGVAGYGEAVLVTEWGPWIRILHDHT
jgi:hypothetical protein